MGANYYLLDDMEKYNKTFDRKAYENVAEADTIEEFRKYYRENLPVDLLTWMRVNLPDDKMIYKKAAEEQMIFVRDKLNKLFYTTYNEYKNNPVMVISTHGSKSITLPVYEIALKEHNVRITLRDNFYDWKVTVESDKEIQADFKETFIDGDKAISSVYCEGFPDDRVLGRFCDNKKEFTVEIDDKFKLYTFMWLLNDYLKRRDTNG